MTPECKAKFDELYKGEQMSAQEQRQKIFMGIALEIMGEYRPADCKANEKYWLKDTTKLTKSVLKALYELECDLSKNGLNFTEND